jgi:transketolase
MAIAEKTLAAQFNTAEHKIVNHRTYLFMGDGCMMEGISHEACSLAGTLQLGKLIAFWDDNGISIDGEVNGWFTDDTPARFRAYGWQVIDAVDGHDADQIMAAIASAQEESDKPTLICCKTVIGKGSPNKQGTENCHGAPLGSDEIKLVREQLDWHAEPFTIPDELSEAWDATVQGAEYEQKWQMTFDAYKDANPDRAEEFIRRLSGDLPENWTENTDALIEQVDQQAAKLATRKASLQSLNQLGPLLPELIGGSADLAGSNYTIWDQSKAITGSDADGNYLYFGVREFAMSAICNGLALYGGFKPYAATFLVFSDYMRNGMRMSALMGLPVIYILTHDSIGLGEDGPTHQPVEHVASLRLIPNMSLWRPCDAVESLVAWKIACEVKDKPSSLIFSRQGLAHQNRDAVQLANIEKGGYVLKDCDGEPDLIMIATGSEVDLAMHASVELDQKGVATRVVSMPCTDLYDAQDVDYQESVLPQSVSARIAIEAGISDYWYKYVGLRGNVIGMQSFGESAPADQLFEHFGFSLSNVLSSAEDLLAKKP